MLIVGVSRLFVLSLQLHTRAQSPPRLHTMDFKQLFSFEVFFIILRESLEIIVIVSILLAFLKQSLVLHHGRDSTGDAASLATSASPTNAVVETDALVDIGAVDMNQELTETGDKMYRQFRLQIWLGSMLGLFIAFLIGGVFITIFYMIGTDLWSLSEHYYEGSLSLLASVVISVMGMFFLRLSKLKEKFRIKLANLLLHTSVEQLDESSKRSKFQFYIEKYALFFLPFITCLRESLEAFVFIGGVGLSQPLSTLPLSALFGVMVSGVAGYYLYRSSNSMSLKIFLISTTCLLYMIAAGLFSKGVWQFELQRYINLCHGQDMSEVGSGPGSYDITNSVWHVNCCNGEIDGFWMLFTAILGWTNSATWGSVISYIVYWGVIVFAINVLRFEERNGYIPYVPLSWQKKKLLKKLNLWKMGQRMDSTQSIGYIPHHLIKNDVSEVNVPGPDTPLLADGIA